MAFQNFRTWVFDLDDTLYCPSLKLLADVHTWFRDYLAENHGFCTDRFEEEKARLVAQGVMDPMGELKKMVDFDNDGWGAYIVKKANYEALAPCDKAPLLIAELPGQRAILTNGVRRHAETVLSRIQLADHFHHVSTNSDRNLRLKPEPSVYVDLQTALNADPATTIMIDDQHKALKPAADMGWTTVLLYNTPPEGVDYIHHAYPNLLSFLQDAAPVPQP